jgi:iron complex transport system permease protein
VSTAVTTATRRVSPVWWVAGGFIVLLLAVVLSLALGTRVVPLAGVGDALLGVETTTPDAGAVLSRIPTTIAGLVVGAALGIGGALMQGMARNPLADPGLLGVNAGAALFVVIGMSVFGWNQPIAVVWLALLGAAVAVVAGYGAAAASPAGATPVSLALAGAAITAIAFSFLSGIVILDTDTLNAYRFWQVGSLTAATWEDLAQLAAFLVAGLVLAVLATGSLNALALGDDVARGLGVRVGTARVVSIAAVVLLCGTATALVGPIGFVGLAVPHAVRFLVGGDYRWVVPLSALVGGTFLLLCDVIGRVVSRPAMVEVGIVTAVVGAPVFILLLRRGKAVSV